MVSSFFYQVFLNFKIFINIIMRDNRRKQIKPQTNEKINYNRFINVNYINKQRSRTFKKSNAFLGFLFFTDSAAVAVISFFLMMLLAKCSCAGIALFTLQNIPVLYKNG